MKTIITVLSFCLLLNNSLMAQNAGTPKENTKLLELAGALSAGVAYNTYLAIGAVVDGHGGKTYTDQKVKDLMDEQIGLLGAIRSIVDSTVASGEVNDPNDVYFLQDLSKILAGMVNQADYYKTYVDERTEINKQRYDRQRRSNWDLIAKLMGLEG